jgi:hypothetical protein
MKIGRYELEGNNYIWRTRFFNQQVVVNAAGSSSGTGTLYASPTSGSAPLTVNFTGSVQSAGYSIDYGDGSTSGDVGCAHGACSPGSGPTSVSKSHAYANNGTYTAKLRNHFASNAANCQGVDCNVVGTATINVGTGSGTGGDSLSVTPTSGAAPLTATFNVRINGSGSCTGGTYTLDFGNGQRAELTYPANVCQYRDVIVTHQYTANGNYIAKLYAFPPSQIGTITQPVASATVTVSGTGTASTTDPQLTVTPGYGGVLRQVQVTFRKDNCHGFSLNWGDNSAIATESPSTSTCGTVEQKSFTHTYPTVTGSVSYTINLAVASSTTRTATIVIVGS